MPIPFPLLPQSERDAQHIALGILETPGDEVDLHVSHLFLKKRGK